MARFSFSLRLASATALLLVVIPPFHLAQAQQIAYQNGLGLTPQMGWDNWNAFGCDIDEDLLLDTAQKIVDYG